MSEDRPQYQRDTVPTNAEIAERLRTISEQLADLGCDMEFLGGFGWPSPKQISALDSMWERATARG